MKTNIILKKKKTNSYGYTNLMEAKRNEKIKIK